MFYVPTIETEHQRPAGLLQPLSIAEWKWEHVTMDFIIGLSKSGQGHDAIWVIVDCLRKMAHFIPYCITYTADKMSGLSERYRDSMVIHVSQTLDCDPCFTSLLGESSKGDGNITIPQY